MHHAKRMTNIFTFVLFALLAVTAHAESTPAGTIPVVTLDSSSSTTPAKPKVVHKTTKPKSTTTTQTTASTTATVPALSTSTSTATTTTPTITTTTTTNTKPLKATKIKKVKEPKTAKTKTPKSELKEKTLVVTNSHMRNQIKGMKVLSASGSAFLDFGSYEKMYLDSTDNAAITAAGSTVSSITAGGIGGNVGFEYGFSDRISGTFSAGYSRLTYSNKFRALVAENFFGVDVTANYYVSKNAQKILPYVSAGVGMVASTERVLPTLDIGGGAQFFVSDTIAIKAQLLAKAAFIFNRLEPSIGVAYHF